MSANKVKTETPILVIMGNPPYSGISANMGEWIVKLIEDYKVVDGKPLGERKHWLQDDYVKFIRFAQWKISKAGQGILAFVTNHGYLDNPTFRGMRQSLLNSFTDIYILNLHGSSKKKEKCPDGSKDENVFDIQQGVAIGIFVKEAGNTCQARVHYADLWGLRDSKYDFLGTNSVESTEWQELKPHSPDYFFVPRQEGLTEEYEQSWSVKDIFSVNSTGIVTARDHFVIDFNREALSGRIESFRSGRETFGLKDTGTWKLEEARRELQKLENPSEFIQECLYRPFDTRWLFYHPTVIEGPRSKVMRHMLAGRNMGLITTRQVSSGQFEHSFCSDKIIESCAISDKTKEINCLFPLYLFFDEKARPLPEPVPNLNLEFLRLVEERTGRSRSPEDIFYYIYGILYTPAYRTRYNEFLKYDFPRIPVFDGPAFERISQLGSGLVELHLMRGSFPRPRVCYPISGTDIVKKVEYNEASKRVWINDTQSFEGVEPSAWEYHIGGYQVLDKWLKERKKWGKPLTLEMIEHFQQVHEILLATIDLQAKLDEAWPLR
ncbi:MAG: type ISP restriction/modification enzyme [candidate division WOR-3 bacterium]